MGDDAYIPDCETGEGCPLADPNFPEDADEVLVEATQTQCRCRDAEFIALFERSAWFRVAKIYLDMREAGVAPPADELSYRERFAVSLLHQKLEAARAQYQKAMMDSKHPQEDTDGRHHV